MGLTLFHQASVPKTFCPFAFQTAVYLINRLVTQILHHTSPYAKLFGTSPNYLKLKIFGTLCYPWLCPYTTNKFQDRSLPCVFFGYSLTQNAYLCYHTPTGCLYVSRHVEFVESQYPFATTTIPPNTPPPSPPLSPPIYSPPTIIPLNPGHSYRLSSPPVPSSLDQPPRTVSCKTFTHTYSRRSKQPSFILGRHPSTTAAQTVPDTQQNPPTSNPDSGPPPPQPQTRHSQNLTSSAVPTENPPITTNKHSM